MDEVSPKGSKLTWIAVTVVAALFLGALTTYAYLNKPNPPARQNSSVDSAKISQLIQADFIDLDKIFSISKFRSGSGHDFSSSGETCRSMKHYYNVQWSEEGERLRNKETGMPPPPDGKNDIPIYSPVDGEVSSIRTENTPIGEQIFIKPDSEPNIAIRLFHIYKLDGITKGVKVKAGQQIGVIGQYQNTDIAVMKGRQFISYFEIMPDSIFAKYQARGVKSRDELIITKEYRDANPLECNGELFARNYDSDPNSGNFVNLK